MLSTGSIATSAHVVKSAREVSVVFDGGQMAEAVVVGMDASTDLAGLKVMGPLPPRVLSVALADSDLVQVGDWVVAIGNPFGLKSRFPRA